MMLVGLCYFIGTGTVAVLLTSIEPSLPSDTSYTSIPSIDSTVSGLGNCSPPVAEDSVFWHWTFSSSLAYFSEKNN